jgi:hypothetical protein
MLAPEQETKVLTSVGIQSKQRKEFIANDVSMAKVGNVYIIDTHGVRIITINFTKAMITYSLALLVEDKP